MRRLAVVLVAAMAATSCTDAGWDNFATLGDPHKVELYSGGVKVREWRSTGKVQTEGQSDGYIFRDAETGDFVRVTGDCVVTALRK